MEQLLLFPMMEDQSTSSSEGRPARTQASRVKGRASSRGRGRNSPSPLPVWLTSWRPTEDFNGLSGRTSPACSPSTEDVTSPLFFRVLQDGTLQSPKADGKTSESSAKEAAETSDSAGECWTCSMCEWTAFPVRFRRDEGVSSLSDILVRGSMPQRYYLSQKAKQGICRRAENRGKVLPEILRKALMEDHGTKAE